MAKLLIVLFPLFFGVGLAQLVTDRPEYCKYQGETGLCKAYVPSYYYNVNTHRCEFFVYGGCGGNANRFPTREKCEDVCKAEIRGENPDEKVHRGPPEICGQDPEVGNCLARIPRYYFNYVTNRCEVFYYGGCGGNSNNFRTIIECELTCLAEFS